MCLHAYIHIIHTCHIMYCSSEYYRFKFPFFHIYPQKKIKKSNNGVDVPVDLQGWQRRDRYPASITHYE